MAPSDPPSLVPPEALEEAAHQARLMREHMREVAAEFAASTERLRALTAGIAVMTEPFAGLMAEIHSGYAERAARIAEIARAAQEGLREAIEDFAEAERLGTFGWTIPMHAPLSDVRDLLHAATDQASADAAFERYYAEDESCLADLRRHVLKSPVLAPWKEWLDEALFAFDAGKYRVCVPSLVAIMDGVAHTYWHPEFFWKGNRRDFFAAELRKHEPGDVSHSMWLSIRAFVDTVFAKAESQPSVFNRNWMMHGRGVPAGTRIECIRVLQAIGMFADHAEEAGEAPQQACAQPRPDAL